MQLPIDSLFRSLGGMGNALGDYVTNPLSTKRDMVLQDVLQKNLLQNEIVPQKGGGLFGGGFRDILGSIGDALLIANDADPMYATKKAMDGFTDDPLAAIKRLAKVNAPLAQKYYNDYLDSQASAATVAEQARGHDITREKNLFEEEQKVRGITASMLNTATDSTFGPLRDRALKFAASKGYDLSGELPSTVEEAKNWARGTMEMKDQEAAGYRDARLGQFERGLGIQEDAEYGRNFRAGLSQYGANYRAGLTQSGQNYRATLPARPTNKKSSGDIARPAASGKPTKAFIIESGVIKKRQADGSYK